ncbi:MAG: sulfite exporter TauE/SafE family protein [Promethearchaeota archaeon]
MSVGVFFLVALLATGIGFLASMFGIGGGFLLVPSMILVFGLETHLTVGTTAFVIIFMSASSVVAYARQKRIDYAVTLSVAGASIVGAVLGALATRLVSGQFILVGFGVTEATLAVVLGTKKTPQEKLAEALAKKGDLDGGTYAGGAGKIGGRNEPAKRFTLYRVVKDALGITHVYKAHVLVALPLSFVAGFLSSLLGIGGGTLYIQIFVFLCGMPIHLAIASSMFTIFLSHLLGGGLTFVLIGQVDYVVAAGYAIGMVAGAQLGALVGKRTGSVLLKRMAAALIVVIAVRMIYFALVENPGA